MEARLESAGHYFSIENSEQLPGILSQLGLQRNVLLAAARRGYAEATAPLPHTNRELTLQSHS